MNVDARDAPRRREARIEREAAPTRRRLRKPLGGGSETLAFAKNAVADRDPHLLLRRTRERGPAAIGGVRLHGLADRFAGGRGGAVLCRPARCDNCLEQVALGFAQAAIQRLLEGDDELLAGSLICGRNREHLVLHTANHASLLQMTRPLPKHRMTCHHATITFEPVIAIR